MSRSGDAFCKYLDSLVQDLRKLTPEALHQFDEKSIHKARVTTRRLKAAIELLEPILKTDRRKPFARVGKKLRRRLGPLRDLDVMLGHLEEIKPSPKMGPGVEWLRIKLDGQRNRTREKITGKTSIDKILVRLGDWLALREDVSSAQDEVHSLLSESVHLQLDRFIENANHIHGADDPHALRIAGKALRYTLELAKAHGYKLPAGVLSTFKRMQDMLGLWHDHVVLAERAMQASIDNELALHNVPLQRQVIALVDYSVKKAEQDLNKFAKLWQQRGEELTATIRTAIPLTEVVIKESKTDPDPADSPPPPAQEAAVASAPPAA